MPQQEILRQFNAGWLTWALRRSRAAPSAGIRCAWRSSCARWRRAAS
jgi:hypothetical protein